MNLGPFQLVWWSPIERCEPVDDDYDVMFGVRRPKLAVGGPMPKDGPFRGSIYRARALIGWLEVRVWGSARARSR
jgi:hypothetical protein